MPTSARIAAAAATLLSLLCAAAGAQAAPSPGVNISAYADAAHVPAATKQVRFFVPWRNFEPDNPAQMDTKGPKIMGSNTTELKTAVSKVRAAGRTPLLVVLDAPDWAAGGSGPHRHPRQARDLALFMGELADWLAGPGKPIAYEVWNEPDAPHFWGAAPDPDLYAAMLKESYVAVKAADPGATVLSGPTTGNNFTWVEGLYARGAKGFFDGVSVHTDTACSIVGPDVFYRGPDGRLGQYTFLAYREVRKSMLANGDDKPIWMSEVGWATTNATCPSGESAGKKPEGVSEVDQAAFLLKAFACMANDPYVVSADWFTLRDDTGNPYGLRRANDTEKPSWLAFAAAEAQLPAECGDFTPPSIDVQSPTEGQVFDGRLDVRASAADAGVGLGRISYAYDGGKEIRNFTEALTNGGAVGLAPWYGSSALAPGPHTIEVIALDKNGNTDTRVVHVTKVPAGQMKATLAPAFQLAKGVSCGRFKAGKATCRLDGLLAQGGAGRPSIEGKVAVAWEWKTKGGKWSKLVGGLKPANKAFSFTSGLKKRGAWRVRVSYAGSGTYLPATSRTLGFRVR